jgi:hypothetical protein
MKKFLTITFCLLAALCRAQLLIQSGAGFYPTGPVSIVLQDMDMINNGSIIGTLGNETFVFSGNSSNGISGTASTAFKNLKINKTAGQKLTLNRNVQVGSAVMMVSGNIDIGIYILGLAEGAALSGESDVSKIMSSSPSGYLYYNSVLNAPNNQEPGKLGLVITSQANIGSTTIRRHHIAQPIGIGQSSISRYYEVFPTNNSGLNATLKFKYLDSELNGLNESTLTLWKQVGASAYTDQGAESRDVVANFVQKSGINSFSNWTFATSSGPLPVRLITFTAKSMEQNSIQLEWETEMESNFKEFEIQRSSNPQTGFLRLASVRSLSAESGKGTYHFLDNAPEPGVLYYYRLKMIDNDESYAHSKMVTGVAQGQDAVNVFPNPATTSIQIHTKDPVERIELLTLSGKILLDQEANPTGNKLTLPQLTSGNYLLRVLLKNGRTVVRQVLITK